MTSGDNLHNDGQGRRGSNDPDCPLQLKMKSDVQVPRIELASALLAVALIHAEDKRQGELRAISGRLSLLLLSLLV